MPIFEIERRFLVDDPTAIAGLTGRPIEQVYLTLILGYKARIRIVAEQSARFSLKSPKRGYRRLEFEFALPLAIARLCLRTFRLPRVRKTRYELRHGAHLWVIDAFGPPHDDLMVGEVELAHANQPIELPPWVGLEISHDKDFGNSHLAALPTRRTRD